MDLHSWKIANCTKTQLLKNYFRLLSEPEGDGKSEDHFMKTAAIFDVRTSEEMLTASHKRW